LLGPVPNLSAILISAKFGHTPEIDTNKLRLIGYRDKVVALISILEGDLTTTEGKATATPRKAILVPKAA
jgi:hypothetical protein